MTRSLLALLVCAAVAGPVVVQTAMAESAAVATKGKMLVSSDGTRLGPVYRVGADGSAQLIFDGHMVTVPADSLSLVDGKLTTSLTKSAVVALK
jgi:hypothetical protein